MYKIDSKHDVPNSVYLEKRVKQMMAQGIKIGNVDELYNSLISQRDGMANILKDTCGITNPNSSKQIVGYMESLNDATVTSASFDNCGKWSSNKEIMTLLADAGYEFAENLLKYRKAKKYADSINAMMKAKDGNGRIHPTVTLTKTNRISYSDPALMSIPKELIWDCIVPTAPGNILISADIKNQEPCIMINMQDVKSLKPALTSNLGLYEQMLTSMPIHGKLTIFSLRGVDHQYIADKEDIKRSEKIPVSTYQATKVSHTGVYINNEQVKLIGTIPLVTPVGQMPVMPKTIKVETYDGNIYDAEIDFTEALEDKAVSKIVSTGGFITIEGVIKGLEIRIHPNLRKEFKRAWNAMTYGASIIGVKNMCKEIDGEELFKYFSRIPEIKKYKYECEKKARSNIQNTLTYFGTIVSAGAVRGNALKRVLMDLPIQGTAADILSLLVKHFDEETQRMGIADKLRIYFTRHDELIIEAHSDLVKSTGIDKILDIVADLTVHQVDDWEPFKMDIEVISNSSNTNIDEMEDTENE